MRPLSTTLVLALLAAGCGQESSVIDRLAPSGPQSLAASRPIPQSEPTPPPSASTLVVAGDVRIEDRDPDVFAELVPETGREVRLKLELRHRVGSKSQPDAVLVFLNVPAKSGTYALHTPEATLLPGRVYACLTSRGDALGDMKDFASAVAGTLTLRREGTHLVGTFHLVAQEPEPTPRAPLPGQPPPRPAAGTVPPKPPGRVEATGTLTARLPLPPQEVAQAAPRLPAARTDLTGG
jgi:hypothetical protein